MTPEFTGKTREVYCVRVTLERQRQTEHTTEGWINMPADKPEILFIDILYDGENEQEARAFFKRPKS